MPILLLLVGTMLVPPTVSAQNVLSGDEPPVAPIVDQETGAEIAAGRLIVKFKPGLGAAKRAAIRSQERLERPRQLSLIGAEVVTVVNRPVGEAVRALQRRPDVEYAEPDFVLRSIGSYSQEPLFNNLWGLHNAGQTIGGREGVSDVDVNSPEAALLSLGDSNVVVAVLDDGVDFSHPDLAGRAWVNPGESGAGRENNGIDDDGNGYVDDVHGWDFYNRDGSVHDLDQDDHGTHVAGTVAASLNGAGVVGVAPGITIMALKILGSNGGSVSSAIEALEYAKDSGVRISNNSYGSRFSSLAHRDAIAASGMLFVAAAGNEGEEGNEPFYPAAYDLPNILSVAAVDNRGDLATFSSHGPTVHISAPGQDILSAIPATSSAPATWLYGNGTSMAAPHATGAAALAASTMPSLLSNPVAMKERLLATGKLAAKTEGLTVTGLLIDAWAAANPFEDIVTSTFKYDISWLFGQRITSGCGAMKYCPSTPITRGQIATFLARALDLPATETDYFDDDNGTTHEKDINRLAAAGITTGCGPRRYCPADELTRGQMASILSRALSLAPTASDYFDDDNGTTHEKDINRLAAAGITTGCGPARFCPTEPVTRGEMAAFLRRALSN